MQGAMLNLFVGFNYGKFDAGLIESFTCERLTSSNAIVFSLFLLVVSLPLKPFYNLLS